MANNIKQEILDGFDFVVQETGNTYVALRKVRWSEVGEPRYDIRKYVTQSDGSEMLMKGCSLNNDGMKELTNILTREGFGDTCTIVENIKDRDDFALALAKQGMNDENREILQTIFPDLKDVEVPEEEEIYDIRKELM